VKYLRRQLELALSQPDRDISSTMDVLFPLQTKAKAPFSSWHDSGRSDEPFVHEVGDVQQAESTGWASIVVGAAVAVGALILAGRTLRQNRDNQ